MLFSLIIHMIAQNSSIAQDPTPMIVAYDPAQMPSPPVSRSF